MMKAEADSGSVEISLDSGEPITSMSPADAVEFAIEVLKAAHTAQWHTSNLQAEG